MCTFDDGTVWVGGVLESGGSEDRLRPHHRELVPQSHQQTAEDGVVQVVLYHGSLAHVHQQHVDQLTHPVPHGTAVGIVVLK